jgi:hypothetical protein
MAIRRGLLKADRPVKVPCCACFSSNRARPLRYDGIFIS